MKIKAAALLLTFFITRLAFGQAKSEDLKIDTTITGFHFAANFSGTKVYTPKGPSDITGTVNPSAFSFTLMPQATYATAREQLDQLLQMSVTGGYTQSDIIKKDTVINGNKVYYVSLKETLKRDDYQNLVFDAFVLIGDTAIVFTAGDLDKGRYLAAFKKTFFNFVSNAK